MAEVSVIVPVYNVEKYLKQSIESLINQSFQDIEIIMIDDCSSDGSLSIIEDYSSLDNRIKIIKNKVNLGQGLSRNSGLEIASGKYIMFLDPDDWYNRDTVLKTYNQINRFDNDLVIFPFISQYENEAVFNDNMIRPFKNVKNKDSFSVSEIEENFIVYCYSWAGIYKKSFLDKNNIRFSALRACEDQQFFIPAILAASSISFLEEPLYNYRRITSSTSFRNNYFKDSVHARSNALKYIASLKDKDIFLPKYIPYMVNTMFGWYNNLKNKENNKEFYFLIKTLFKDAKNLLDEDELEKLKYSINYQKFNDFIKYDLNTLKLINFLRRIFSIHKDYKKNKTILYILGLKFTLKK